MKKISILAILALLSGNLLAEGYQVNLQSTRQTGMGHTGTGMKLGAESMHFNPAGLSYIENEVDVSGGISLVATKAKYDDNNGYTAETNSEMSTPFFLYAGFKAYGDVVAAGVSVTTPYGSSLGWGDTWRGEMLVQDISLQSYVVQPTVSVKLAEGLTFGAGLMLGLGNFNIQRGLMPVGSFGIYDPSYSDDVAMSLRVSGDSKMAVGYNLGAMYDVNERITVGVSYRSKMKMKVDDGRADLLFINREVETLIGINGDTPPIDDQSFSTELPLPSNFNIGVSYSPTEDFTFAADMQFVGWKAYDSLKFTFHKDGLAPYNSAAPREYHNTVIYRIGASYVFSDRFTGRAGVYYDPTPINTTYYSPETPGSDKTGFSAGCTIGLIDNMTLDLALLYINGRKINGSYPVGQGVDFKGTYKPTAMTVSMGLSYKF